MHTLKTLEKIKTEILESNSTYSEFKEKYLGTKGLVTLALKDITTIDKKDRAEYGKQINEIKNIGQPHKEALGELCLLYVLENTPFIL